MSTNIRMKRQNILLACDNIYHIYVKLKLILSFCGRK